MILNKTRRIFFLLMLGSISLYGYCNTEIMCASPLIEDATKHRTKPISLRLEEFNDGLDVLNKKIKYGNSLNEYEIYELNRLYHRFVVRLMNDKRLLNKLVTLKNLSSAESIAESIGISVDIEDFEKDIRDKKHN